MFSLFYPSLRTLLFQMDPETAHHWTLKLLRSTPLLPLNALLGAHVPAAPRRVMNIDFPNPVGLAAGLDKDGECINAWAPRGCGCVNVGSI